MKWTDKAWQWLLAQFIVSLEIACSDNYSFVLESTIQTTKVQIKICSIDCDDRMWKVEK